MAIIRKSYDNSKRFIGLLTNAEIEHAEELLKELEINIPSIETTLQNKHGNGLDYKYYLGEYLAKYIDQESIKDRERLYFWREIEEFASLNNNPKSESNQRHFYEYCYIIFSFGYKIAHSLTYRQWNDILARKRIRQDVRIFNWFEIKNEEKANLYWRNFLPTLNEFLSKKDTSVFSIDELYQIYESILIIARV